jgi:hypothetical protein
MKEILISSNPYVCERYQKCMSVVLAERAVVEFEGLLCTV